MSGILFSRRVIFLQSNEPYLKNLVLIPTLNEKENIRELVETINRLRIEIDILVIDDFSSDGTILVLEELSEKYPNFSYIVRRDRKGLGSAHLDGIRYANGNNYDCLVTMDADFSHNPLEIPMFLTTLVQADFVIGTRWSDGGFCDYTGIRYILSFLANRISRLALGMNLSEYTSSFRAFNKSALTIISQVEFVNEGYAFFIELCWVVKSLQIRYAEVGIRFEDRKRGKSKIPKTYIFTAVALIASIIYRRVITELKVSRRRGSIGNE